MDIFIIFDALAILLAGGVYWKTKSRESLYLLYFFVASTVIYSSLFFIAGEFSADLSGVGVKIFFVLSLIFGLMSKSHPIVLGYMANIAILAMNQATPLEYYSFYMYSIYAFQLLMVFNDRNHNNGGRRNHLFAGSHG